MNRSKIAKLQFITPPSLKDEELLDISNELCSQGLRWIQFRKKFQEDELNEYTKAACIQLGKELLAICKKHHSKLIINDHVWLFEALGADGLHLGRKDFSLEKARLQFGNEVILGTSSNSIPDLMEACQKGADYSGLGPIHVTSTKPDHNPTLGWEKTIEIISSFKTELPIVLIGGISQRDLPLHPSLESCGIALSSALVNTSAISNFQTYLTNF